MGPLVLRTVHVCCVDCEGGPAPKGFSMIRCVKPPPALTARATNGEPWLTAAIPVENPCCSCKLIRVRRLSPRNGASARQERGERRAEREEMA